jgi:hypothetical protein
VSAGWADVLGRGEARQYGSVAPLGGTGPAGSAWTRRRWSGRAGHGRWSELAWSGRPGTARLSGHSDGWVVAPRWMGGGTPMAWGPVAGARWPGAAIAEDRWLARGRPPSLGPRHQPAWVTAFQSDGLPSWPARLAAFRPGLSELTSQLQTTRPDRVACPSSRLDGPGLDRPAPAGHRSDCPVGLPRSARLRSACPGRPPIGLPSRTAPIGPASIGPASIGQPSPASSDRLAYFDRSSPTGSVRLAWADWPGGPARSVRGGADAVQPGPSFWSGPILPARVGRPARVQACRGAPRKGGYGAARQEWSPAASMAPRGGYGGGRRARGTAAGRGDTRSITM